MMNQHLLGQSTLGLTEGNLGLSRLELGKELRKDLHILLMEGQEQETPKMQVS